MMPDFCAIYDFGLGALVTNAKVDFADSRVLSNGFRWLENLCILEYLCGAEGRSA